MGSTIRPEAEAILYRKQSHSTISIESFRKARAYTIQGTAGNLGMYMSGIPFGMLIDSRGPRWGVALGGILLAVGYYPIRMGMLGNVLLLMWIWPDKSSSL